MAKGQHEDPQVISRKFQFMTLNHGVFDFESFDATNLETAVAQLPTGQEVSTGKDNPDRAGFTLLAGDDEQCARMQIWRNQVRAGTPGYKDSATLVGQHEDGTPGMLAEYAEVFPVAFGTPAFSTDGDGEAAMRSGSMSCWGGEVVQA